MPLTTFFARTVPPDNKLMLNKEQNWVNASNSLLVKFTISRHVIFLLIDHNLETRSYNIQKPRLPCPDNLSGSALQVHKGKDACKQNVNILISSYEFSQSCKIPVVSIHFTLYQVSGIQSELNFSLEFAMSYYSENPPVYGTHNKICLVVQD